MLNNSDLLILIGEKGGKQARDNGYAYFSHRIDQGYKNTYFIYDEKNIDLDLLLKYKDNIVLKNSKNHFILFEQADYLLLTDGFQDVFPDKKNILMEGWAPIVYLQHGITSYKQIYFSKGHYYGRILRLLTTTNFENKIFNERVQSKKDILLVRNLIKKYKVEYFKSYFDKKILNELYLRVLSNFYKNSNREIEKDLNISKKVFFNIGLHEKRLKNIGFPRHDNLFKKQKDSARDTIVFFFSWRDHWLCNSEDNEFYNIVKDVIGNKYINKYAEDNGLKIAFYLHEKISFLKDKIDEKFNGEVNFIGQDDFSELLERAKVCVTDYSSIAFEFNFLKVPVLFIHFDYQLYMSERGYYLDSPYDFYGKVFKSFSDFYLFFKYHNNNSLNEIAETSYNKLVLDYPNFLSSCSTLDKELSLPVQHYVFFCYNIYGVGGTVQTVINQASELVKLGVMVTIVSMRRTSEESTLHIDPSIRIITLNDVRNRGKFRTKKENFLAKIPSLLFDRTEDLYDGFSLLTDLKLYSVIKSFNNSILIGTLPGLVINLIRFSNKNNTIVAQEHKVYQSHSHQLKRAIKKYYKKASIVSVLTKDSKKQYTKEGINNVVIIPNGIPDYLPLLSPLKLSKNKRIVAFGRLVKEKNYHVLIEAFHLIAHKNPFWCLDIYGTGPERNNLLKLINEYNLQDRIRLKGATSLVIEELYNSEFCVHPSSLESFGMVYIEAFSMGKTVVSFDIGTGPKEFLKHEENCLTAKCFDIRDYANCMDRLMNDPELLDSLGQNARKCYEEKYDISVVVEKFRNALTTCHK